MEKKYLSNHGLGEFEADEQTVRVCWTLYRSEKDWKKKNGLVFHSYRELTKFIRLKKEWFSSKVEHVYVGKYYPTYLGSLYANYFERHPNPHYKSKS